jgi:hypothetical protein
MESHSHNGAYHKFFLEIRLFFLTPSPIVLQKQASKTMGDFNYLHITGVNDLPGYHAAAAFTTKSSEVFKEAEEISPRHVSDKVSYMPWGADDQMPYDIINLIESDETLSTCQMFNAEVCYGSGLVYQTDEMCKQKVVNEVEEFFLDNDMASYFLGVCQDFKHFGFAVSVIILNEQGNKVVRVLRKEVCYVRFAPANKEGVIPQVLYANWRNSVRAEQVEVIPLLNPQSLWTDLQAQVKKGKRKFAVVSRVPTPDSTYYPIPYYASLFKGKWYNIKQLIGVAKEAKLKNSAPIKYHIEIAKSFWSNIFKAEGITDRVKQQERVNEEKDNIINFLTGMENSGKVLFSEFYVSPNGEEQHDVVINKIETDKEGGDWATDIIEAVNMMCFTMRVHSNLVGSVPGKSQTNNSGSDKRELYTIAQALQKPYHDLLFNVHRLIIRFNRWDGAYPDCPFIQLTTLDENKDAKQVSTEE